MSEMLLTAYDGAILGPIAKLLGWVMNGVYYLMDQIGIGNVGLSIIIFTILFIFFCSRLLISSRSSQSCHRRCSRS